MGSDSVAELAATALRLAMEDPDRAEALALEARKLAVEGGRADVESAAWRALGLAARSRHQIPEALTHLRTALEVAARTSDPVLDAEARLSLAAALVLAGENDQAMTVLDGAHAGGRTAVEVASQRAMILAMLGRYDEALRAYRPVIPSLHRLGDPVLEARARNNRGLLHVYTGHFARAEADLVAAERLMRAAGHPTEAASYCHNRGFAAARRGDLPTALALFEQADQACRAVGVLSGARSLDRAGALQAAGLLSDARQVVDEALGELRDGGNQSDLAEGLVLLSDIALLGRDAATSRAAAQEAAQLFASQQREAWLALARAAIARAAWLQGDADPSLSGVAFGADATGLAAEASEAADQLDRVGLADRALAAHAVAGRLWLAAGDSRAGLEHLDRAARGRRRGTAAGRLAAWEAAAVARLARQDRRGAQAALRSALAVVDRQQASLGATELRANVVVHAGAAARLGLRLALEGGQASSILTWMERRRANSLRVWPARPPLDDTLAGQLSELRAVAQDIASIASSGDDPRVLFTRQAELEKQVRERSWHTAGVGDPARPAPPPNRSDLYQALDGAALIELAEMDGLLHAVVVADRRCRYRALGPLALVRRELSQLRLSLRRLAYAGTGSALGSGAEDQLAQAAERLDELILAPLVPWLGTGPVVIVPTGELHATPWATLPTLSGRPVSVSPSARLWLQATSSRSAGPSLAGSSRAQPRVSIVAGPGLPGADREVAALASLYPFASVLTGPDARATAVASALEGTDLTHVAAHASFRADNALWSSLALADGPLTVYELERLRVPPRLVVLSACQAGLSAVRPGDELMGLVAALLTLGTPTVVASVLPVDDEGGQGFMVEFHRHLVDGQRPAEALAAVQSVTADRPGLSYVCFGAQ